MVKNIAKMAFRTLPGASVVETVAGGISALTGTEEEEIANTPPFRNRDADQHGAARYATAVQNREDDEIVDAQFVLAKMGYLKFPDIDGCVGPGTLRAIEAWEAAAGKNFYTGDPIEAGDDPPAPQPTGLTMISPRIKQTSQAAPDVADIEIPGKDADGNPLNRPVSQIGCASCSMVSVRDFYSAADINFPFGLRDFIARECYTDQRDLIWGRAVSVISDACGKNFTHSEVSRRAAINYIRDNIPVLCHAGRGHWVTAVGHSDDYGIVYNDPATRLGNGYDDPARNSERKGVKGYSFDRFIAIYPV